MFRPGTWLIVPFLMAFVIIAVNILLIIVIRKTPSLHTVSNMFITSLAVVDLLVGVCVVADASVFAPFVRRHYLDHYHRVCLLLIGVSISTTLMSILHLMAISIDRCICIRAPFFYSKHIDAKCAAVVIACIWFFGVSYTVVPHTHVKLDNFHNVCDVTKVMPVQYVFYINDSIYLASLLVTITMYALILNTAAFHRESIKRITPVPLRQLTAVSLRKFRRQPTQIEEDTGVEEDVNRETLTTGVNELNSPEETEQREYTPDDNAEEEKPYPKSHLRDFNTLWKNIKFFATVFGVYFVLITPATICMSVDYFSRVNPVLYDIFILLALSNSAANFFIYFSLNNGFRKALFKTFGCRERFQL